MKELISREDLLKQIEIDSNGNRGQYGDEWFFIDTIKKMPTIKKALEITKYIPRPQGEWKQVCWKSPIAREIELLFHYKCDNCDKEVRIDRIERYNYCPHCGAEMRDKE